MSAVLQPCVAIVTVTYGRRWHLLSQVLRAVQREPALRLIVVIDNGAQPPVRDCLAAAGTAVLRDDLRIEVVQLARNVGSAAGFARGLEVVRSCEEITHVLLLDDDNLPDPDAIRKLSELATANGAQDIVVSALRKGRREYEELLYGAKRHQIRPDSFLGFHLMELAAKLYRRRRKARASGPGTFARQRELVVAPYGGLFIPMRWVRTVQPPRADLVLYGDDHEYTLRLRRAGAKILLTDATFIDDLDSSWSESEGANPWVSIASPPFRSYYASRNRMYVETEFIRWPWLYRSNRLAYLAVLTALSLRETRSLRKTQRAMRPLLDAIGDFERGITGEREQYRLP